MSLRVALIEGLLLLVALQRLLELRHSRRNLARLSSASLPADSRANWTVIVAAQALWLAGCALETALRGRVAPAPVFWGGIAVFSCGAALRLWCIRRLGPRWNARALVDPGLRVERGGPYRWVRHPNYLGVLLELVGLPLAAGAWVTLAVLLPVHVLALRARMRGEDELLLALPGYAETMGRKGALLPRLSARAEAPRP
jgi:methyltransferase